MGFALKPSYSTTYVLKDVTSEHLCLLAILAAKKLGWSVGYVQSLSFRAYASLSLNSFGEEISVSIEADKLNIRSECIGAQIFDWGKNRRNVDDLIVTTYDLYRKFSFEELESQFEEIKPELASYSEKVHEVESEYQTGIKSIFSVFIPRKNYFITPILLNINILVFIIMICSGISIISPDPVSMIKWGGNFRPVTLKGEWWRLLTANFLHFGIIHLLVNMYALVFVGMLLEPYLKKLKFLLAYVLSGIIGSLVSLWWHDYTVSAGASGAIFGLYGVFLALLSTDLIERTARRALMASIGIFVGYNLLMGMRHGVDNAAHIGGLLSGIAIGYSLVPGLRRPGNILKEFSLLFILFVFGIWGSITVYRSLPNDLGEYEERMKKFALMESEALKIYNMPDASPEQALVEIENGKRKWRDIIELIESLNSLELPPGIVDRNKTLLEYSELRLKSYDILFHAMAEATNKYADSIQYYNVEIQKKVDDLKAPD